MLGNTAGTSKTPTKENFENVVLANYIGFSSANIALDA